MYGGIKYSRTAGIHPRVFIYGPWLTCGPVLPDIIGLYCVYKV